MKLRFLIVLIIILGFSSCCLIKKSQSTEEALESKIESKDTITVDTYRVVVNFISKGEGINHKALEHFQTFLEDIEITFRKKLTYEEVHYGREGEVKYCFKLDEIGQNQRDHFFEELKRTMKSYDRYFIYENIPCDNSSKN